MYGGRRLGFAVALGVVRICTAGRHGYVAGRHGGLMPPIPRHNYSLWIMKYPPTILPPESLESLQCIVFEGIHTPMPLIFNDPARFWCPSWGFACACFYASRWYLSDVHYVKCVLVTANIWFLHARPGIVQWIISACENEMMRDYSEIIAGSGYLCHL